MSSCQNLFKPLQIGPVTIRNRIASSAHVTNFGEGGCPTERHAYYLAEKSKGGIGLIIMEAIRVHPTTHPGPKAIAGYDQRSLPGLKMVAEMVHQHGAKIFLQLLHMGRQTVSTETFRPLWAPSALPCPTKKEIPHAMTKDEIREVVEGFAYSTRLAREAGFDGVEIHGAHGYLIQQFMSPFSNKRTDEYGGSLENRLRFAREVITAVRKAAGKEMAVGIRVSGDEFCDGGLTLSDMQEIVPLLVEAGELDFVNVSQCNYNGLSFATMIPDMHFPLAPFVYLAAGIKQVIPDLSVFTVARINDPLLADQIIENSWADVVCMTRATLCDPELPNKAREGRLDEIRYCVGCNQGCVGMMHRGFPITCLQNPTVGREKELGIGTLRPASKPKRVFVVGGGPAGMEAARVAALRGHRVVLIEKGSELGGQLLAAASVPCRQEISGVYRFLSLELKRLGVEVRLGTTATVDYILAEKPDAVVIATGSSPVLPVYEGEGGVQLATPNDVTLGKVEVGQRIIVFDDDGHYRATSVAEFLADQGREVQIITPRSVEGSDIVQISWITQHQRLRNLGVRIATGTLIRAINGTTVILEDAYSGEQWEVSGVDTIVVAGLRQANDELYHVLKKQGIEVYAVGDCVAPRSALEAIREGHLAGRQI
ncbi:MAG: FAD-dependent oxidoreductase [Bacillota bacterium]